MTWKIALRVAWGILAAPIAVIVVFVSAITWPAVTANDGPALLGLAYCALVPVAALAWRGRKVILMVAAAVVSVALQVAVFGVLNHWFDGTWTSQANVSFPPIPATRETRSGQRKVTLESGIAQPSRGQSSLVLWHVADAATGTQSGEGDL